MGKKKVSFECESCGHIQHGSPASQANCSKCGGYTEIIDDAPQKKQSKRTCKRCGCNLRSGNTEKHCSPCDRALREEF